MPLILFLPLVIAAVLVLLVLLMPLAAVLRYRRGRARRRVQPWGVRLNAWLLLASVPLLVAVAAALAYWIDHAVRDTLAGLVVGIAIGAVGLTLDRFEAAPQGCFRTPNRWVVLGLSLLLAGRVLAGLWLAWGGSAPEGAGALVTRSGLMGVGGVLLGYALATAWGLRRRLRRVGR